MVHFPFMSQYKHILYFETFFLVCSLSIYVSLCFLKNFVLISQTSIHAKGIHKSSIPSIGSVTIRKSMYNEANFTVD